MNFIRNFLSVRKKTTRLFSYFLVNFFSHIIIWYVHADSRNVYSLFSSALKRTAIFCSETNHFLLSNEPFSTLDRTSFFLPSELHFSLAIRTSFSLDSFKWEHRVFKLYRPPFLFSDSFENVTHILYFQLMWMCTFFTQTCDNVCHSFENTHKFQVFLMTICKQSIIVNELSKLCCCFFSWLIFFTLFWILK